MLPDEDLTAYQRRADADMLRIADGQRLLSGLLTERQARDYAEQEMRALKARHEDDMAIIAAQRSDIARLKQQLVEMRHELRVRATDASTATPEKPAG